MPRIETYTSTTSTYTPLTRKVCEQEIVYCAMKLNDKKWYQDKLGLKARLRFYCDELKKIN